MTVTSIAIRKSICMSSLALREENLPVPARKI